MSQELTNIVARMRVRNLRSDRQMYHRWRPMAQNVAASRDLGGCFVRHAKWWDHQVVHFPHGPHIQHSIGRCYFWYHRLPVEVGIRRLLALVRDILNGSLHRDLTRSRALNYR